ncbi:MAG TPA: hypothetical protein VMB81_12500 [Candidatus Sulfotelmatobacter sp.]|nr:hypothetical protein [Candidatus Sulfotelmatobacter sp.]
MTETPADAPTDAFAVAERMISLYGADALQVARGRVRRNAKSQDHGAAASWTRVAQIIRAIKAPAPKSRNQLS